MRNYGFTLIELLIVIFIFVVACVIITNLFGTRTKPESEMTPTELFDVTPIVSSIK